ncbi:transporter substrate-binding domain-containing diguanylate cyclase [Aliivibrio logei]|uniref:diguanylate cyclase n=1 Tax=Aliivibrio logei 5S-186 TaxID=626086 RepID=A0ABX3AVH4_ALILO|nr:transporter substrate-binding domain-containing protein [Aliivibrio logei]OEF16025.1 diguanylate cyclase [Aliivibrio logei 5S-186]
MIFLQMLTSLLLIVSWSTLAAHTVSLTKEEQEYLNSHPTLTVYSDEHFPPYSFLEDGVLKGYSPDYMQLIAAQLNVEIIYVKHTSWAQSLTLLKNNEIDVIANIRKTESRKKYLNFSHNPVFTMTNALLSKKTNSPLYFNNMDLGTFDDYLTDKVVSVVEQYAYQDILSHHYLDSDVLLSSNTLESIEQVLNGNADAAIGPLAVFNYYLSKYYFTSLNTKDINDQAHFTDTYNYLATNKNNILLKNILDKAIESISLDDIHNLNNAWLIKKPIAFKDGLLPLSDAELEYLNTKSQFNYCLPNDLMPFSGVNNGKPIGMSTSLISLIQEKLNIPFQFIPTKDWNESLQKINNRECDLILPIDMTNATLSTLDYTKTVYKSDIVIATKTDARFITNFNHLRDVSIGIIRGYSQSNMTPLFHPSVKIEFVDDLEEGLTKVNSGELFGFIDSVEILSYAIQRHYPSLMISGKVENTWDLRIGTRNDEPLLKSIIEKTIHSIPPEETNTLINNWLSVKYTSPFDVKLFKVLLGVIVAIIGALLYRQKLLKKYNTKLIQLSTYDSLTSLYNRRVIDTHLVKQQKLSLRTDMPLSVIMCDIDYFKKINDTFGHIAGDEVIVNMSALLLNNIRTSDIVGRWGGEEFIIICPNTHSSGAKVLAECLRKKIEKMPATNEQTITMSFGIAQFNENLSYEELLIKADAALYAAKEQGRNKVVIG